MSAFFDLKINECLHRMEAGNEKPSVEGTYAVEVYFGWKLLEWKKGEWWHPSAVGRWTANIPVQWVGPLPARKGGDEKSKQEFDL